MNNSTRIHGKFVIRRKCSIEHRSPYGLYREDLREDFHFMCGYCAKIESSTSKGFEIDHFVPDKIAPEKKTDYANLVYSCYTCNRKKSGKWPTADKNLHHNGEIGILDPTHEDFDLHLARNELGEIVGKTPLGEYICTEIFRFDIRPMSGLWKFSQLDIKIQKLEQKSRESTISEKKRTLLLALYKEHKQLKNSWFNLE